MRVMDKAGTVFIDRGLEGSKCCRMLLLLKFSSKGAEGIGANSDTAVGTFGWEGNLAGRGSSFRRSREHVYYSRLTWWMNSWKLQLLARGLR